MIKQKWLLFFFKCVLVSLFFFFKRVNIYSYYLLGTTHRLYKPCDQLKFLILHWHNRYLILGSGWVTQLNSITQRQVTFREERAHRPGAVTITQLPLSSFSIILILSDSLVGHCWILVKTVKSCCCADSDSFIWLYIINMSEIIPMGYVKQAHGITRQGQATFVRDASKNKPCKDFYMANLYCFTLFHQTAPTCHLKS